MNIRYLNYSYKKLSHLKQKAPDSSSNANEIKFLTRAKLESVLFVSNELISYMYNLVILLEEHFECLLIFLLSLAFNEWVLGKSLIKTFTVIEVKVLN